MTGRKTSPKPAEPRRARARQHQRKPKQDQVAAVSSSHAENDMTGLIHRLADLTQDLARSAAARPAPGSSRSRSRARRVLPTLPPPLSHPRGNPLTPSMEFTARDGSAWLVYIEGSAQPRPDRQPTSAAVLPERHLRFDSATESRFTASVPAGSPFLSEARLQSLLDDAQADPPLAAPSGSRARALSGPEQRLARWIRAVGVRREAIAEWPRRWRRNAGRRHAPRRQLLELLSGAADTVHGIVAVLGHRPARSGAGR